MTANGMMPFSKSLVTFSGTVQQQRKELGPNALRRYGGEPRKLADRRSDRPCREWGQSMTNSDRAQIKTSIENLMAAMGASTEMTENQKAIGLSILGIATASGLDINRIADALEELTINTKGYP